MSRQPLRVVVHHLRQMVNASAVRELSDRQLLERFANHQDEGAFTLLVQRHGALVQSICRRVLRNDHDAEDAFQATFLVLARKAASVRWHDSVRSWLYQVAVRIARQARGRIYRRQTQEQQGPPIDPPQPESASSVSWQDLQVILDEEISRLPERYRAPLLLCCLEGKTRDEAAAQLGWTLGALKARLERGRNRLRQSLTRRGVTLSAALLSSVLAQQATAAEIPALLLVSTVKAGIAFAAGNASAGLVSAPVLLLTKGVLHAMLLTKLKIAAVVLVVAGIVGLSGGILLPQALADRTNPDVSTVQATEDPSLQAIAPPSALVAADGDEKKEKKAEEGRQKDGEKEGAVVSGILKAVDPTKSTITITLRRDGGNLDQTYSVAKDVPVFLAPKEKAEAVRGDLASLKAGMTVVLKLSADRKSVESIKEGRPEGGVKGINLQGVLKAVDATKQTIIVTVQRKEGQPGVDETFDVSKEAIINAGGKDRVPLGDLKPGTRLGLKLSEDKKTVIAIREVRGDKEKE